MLEGGLAPTGVPRGDKASGGIISRNRTPGWEALVKRRFKNLSREQIDIGLYALVLVIVGFSVCLAIWSANELWAKLWSLVWTVIGPLLFGIMLSYMFNPLVSRIEHALAGNKRLAKDGANMRPPAAIITVVMVALVLLVTLVGIAAVLSDGIASVGWGSLQDIIGGMTTDFEGFATSVTQRVEDLGIMSEASIEKLMATFTSVSIAFTTVFFTIIFTMWFLIDGDNLFVYTRRILVRVLGARGLDTTQMLQDADRVFASYSRGQATDALALAALTTLALSLAGVPYAPVVGLLAGIGNLIPYTGGIVGLVATAVVCLIEQNFAKLLIGLVAMGVVMLLDMMLIAPRLLANSIQLHPMAVAIVMFAGGNLGGIAGMIVAIPLATWLNVQFTRWMEINEDVTDERDDSE